MKPWLSGPNPRVSFAAALAVTLLLFDSVARAQAPSIEGTYRLISRTLKDGTVLKPPDIVGLQTYTKSYRNFNILSRDANGQFTSRSIVATYSLTPTEYIETTLFHVYVRGQEIRRQFSMPPQRLAVTMDGGRIQFRTEQRMAVYEGKMFTATSTANVDVWEKVE